MFRCVILSTHQLSSYGSNPDGACDRERRAHRQIDDGSIDIAGDSRQQIEEGPTQAAPQRQHDTVEAPICVEICYGRHCELA